MTAVDGTEVDVGAASAAFAPVVAGPFATAFALAVAFALPVAPSVTLALAFALTPTLAVPVRVIVTAVSGATAVAPALLLPPSAASVATEAGPLGGLGITSADLRGYVSKNASD
ncbi:MAG TPA: hypothetical protein VFZ10_15230, partial [Geminicoccaceae bacterium]